MNTTIKLTWQYVGFGVLMAIALLLFATPRASATLSGENGPIVYVEEVEQETDCPSLQDAVGSETEPVECYDETTAVVTTDAEGQDPITAAESGDDEEITTATISPNAEDGSHEIIYAASGYECVEYGYENELSLVDTSSVEENGDYCYFYDAEARIYRVRVNADREPIGEPELITTATAEEGTVNYENFYYELSYGPDGNSVVGVRFFYATSNYDKDENDDTVYGPNYTIEHIDLTDGTITTLVEPKFDPFLNAGYAQDGTIYFTQHSGEFNGFSVTEAIVIPQDRTSNVWYFAKGSTTPTQLTFTNEVNEYFLSVSPDSKKILVCDPYDMTFYVVDAETGELTLIEIDWDSDSVFLPVFYSPDGESFLGFQGSGKYFYQICGQRILAARTLVAALEDEELDEGVAIAALDDFKNAVVVNGMENPDDWAAVVAYEKEETSQVLGTSTTTSKLQSTGSPVQLALIAGLAVTVIAVVAGAYRKEEN